MNLYRFECVFLRFSTFHQKLLTCVSYRILRYEARVGPSRAARLNAQKTFEKQFKIFEQTSKNRLKIQGNAPKTHKNRLGPPKIRFSTPEIGQGCDFEAQDGDFGGQKIDFGGKNGGSFFYMLIFEIEQRHAQGL